MPTRISKLYRKRGDSDAELLHTSGITSARAHLRHECSSLILDGWSIMHDANDEMIMRSGTDTVRLYIESEAAPKRAPGAGRKVISTSDETVKRSITLLRSHVEELERLGNGNLSAGVRQALEVARQDRRRKSE